jgi:hypothetical protein
MRIAETIAHLKEDEAGFAQEAIRELLSGAVDASVFATNATWRLRPTSAEP